MSIVSHMGGVFVSQTPDLTDHPLAACTPPLTKEGQYRFIALLTSGGHTGGFQGGRFVLDADAGPVCAFCTKRGLPMDSPTFSDTLAAWGLPETLLDAVDPDVRPTLWNGLRSALKASALPHPCWGGAPISQPPLAEAEPAGTRRESRSFIHQHLTRPCLQQEPPRRLDLAGWHQQMRLALWTAAEALEAWRTLPKADAYRLLLAEQCIWIGQLYTDLKRRAGPFFAPVILQGELRFLQHRASAAVTDLLFAA